jgi:hypothetical protein
MSATPAGMELFPYTFATWVFTLFVDGVVPGDDVSREACEAIRAAQDAEVGNAASERLVGRARELVGDGSDAEAVTAAARRLYGDRIRSDLGEGDREERTHRIRKYQFASQLPWLARIWERQATDAGGTVRPGWLLVERVTDEVAAADPNPWDEVDETRRLPVGDFQVLWELDGCTNLYISSEGPTLDVGPAA